MQTANTGKTAYLSLFSKYVDSDMLFLVEKISKLLCFLDAFGIGVPVFSY